MGKQAVYTEELAAKLIRSAHADLESLYVPGFGEWTQANCPHLVAAVNSAFKAIDLPCDASNIQGLHAGLASIRAASADLAAAWRQRLSGGGFVAPAPAPPSPEGIIPKVQMVPAADIGAQELLFGTASVTGPLGQIGA